MRPPGYPAILATPPDDPQQLRRSVADGGGVWLGSDRPDVRTGFEDIGDQSGHPGGVVVGTVADPHHRLERPPHRDPHLGVPADRGRAVGPDRGAGQPGGDGAGLPRAWPSGWRP